uniref:Tetraspanin n=1 Tax=Plectus sambesii TaxID=2011161 RepID=A0A914V6I8_9BILA
MICKCTTRTLLGLLGVAFWAVAIFLWILAGYVIVDYRNYNDFVASRFTLIPAVIIIIVGIVFFFGGLLGCCAVIRDNKCSLCMFGSMLLLITMLLLSAGIAAFVNRGYIEDSIQNTTNEIVKEKYEMNKTSLVKQIDWLQQNLYCCGAESAADWDKSAWSNEIHRKYPIVPDHIVPVSCCIDEGKCGNTTSDFAPADGLFVYTNGCYNKFQDVLAGNLKLIGGCAIGLFVLLVLGVISSCVLMRIYRNEETPYYSLYS